MIDIINIGLGFLEGFALIISPCILPILPIILAGSLEGSKKRPIGIIIGFVIIFALFTFFSRKLVQYSGIDLTLIRHLSYIFLFLFGVVMLSTYLSDRFAHLTQRLAHTGASYSDVNNPQGGFYSGLLFGGLVGLVWTPCAGPILAAVIVQTVIQQASLNSFLIVLAFGVGAALPMLIIALFGRTLLSTFDVFRNHAELFRKMLGILIIASVVYMIYGESFSGSFSQSENQQTHMNKLIGGVDAPYPAPEIAGISDWINSPPLQINQLKGKVVLIDFWTFSCINCIRTLPYLKDWYAKYHDKGFEIIGVHAPEFEFEKNFENVKRAVKEDGILYPVALDNNFVTWRNYSNSYWPAHYLIDTKGNVVYQHFGEGEYATTENNIRFLLGLNVTKKTSQFPEAQFNYSETPETYLGYARMEVYSSPESISYDKQANYTYPKSLSEDAWALNGSWIVTPQRIISAAANASVKIHFDARKVFVVMGSSQSTPIQVKVMLDDKLIKNIVVQKHDLFEALNLSVSQNGMLELITSAPGLEVYTFTFGE